MGANGSAPQMQIPPFDIGNPFVLSAAVSRLAVHDDEHGDDVPDPDLLVDIATADRASPSSGMQTLNAGTAGDGTRVVVATWRVGRATVTVQVGRTEAVVIGRRLVKAAESLPIVILDVPPGMVAPVPVVEVRVEVVDEVELLIRLHRDAALSWGRDWTTAAQGLSGLIVPGSGVHP